MTGFPVVVCPPPGDEEDDDEAVEEPDDEEEGPTRTDADPVPGFKQLFLAISGGGGSPALVVGGCGICVGRFFRAMILGGFRREIPKLLLESPILTARWKLLLHSVVQLWRSPPSTSSSLYREQWE